MKAKEDLHTDSKTSSSANGFIAVEKPNRSCQCQNTPGKLNSVNY